MLLPEVLKLNSSGKNSFTSVSVSYGRIIILVASKFFFLFFFRAAGFFIIIFFPGNLTELEGNLVFSDTLFGNNLRQLSCFYC